MLTSERTEEDLLEQKCLGILRNMMESEPETLAPKLMHTDSFINFLLDTLDDQTHPTNMSYIQLLCSELLLLTLQHCTDAFRSKFVITLQGVIRLLTLIDMRLEEQELGDTTLEVLQNSMDGLCMVLVDDSIKENAQVFSEAHGHQMMLSIIVNN